MERATSTLGRPSPSLPNIFHSLFPQRSVDLMVPAQLALRDAAVAVAAAAEASSNGTPIPRRDPVDPKDVWRAAMIPELERLLNSKHATTSGLRVGVALVHPATAREADLLQLSSKPGRKRRRDGTRRTLTALESFGAPLSALAAKRAAELGGGKGNDRDGASFAAERSAPPPSVPTTPVATLVSVRRESAWVGGYYLKLKRGVSNSPFEINGERVGDTSVQEAIGDAAVQAMGARSCKLLSAGREDVDVRMLGRGRPYCLEIVDPKRASVVEQLGDFKAFEAAIAECDHGVRTRATREVSASEVAQLKASAEEKRKRYRCRVRLGRDVKDADLDALTRAEDLILQQRTPARVAHRRADLVRSKTVAETRAHRDVDLSTGDAIDDPRDFWLDLTTSAGTYVKEFVHGDADVVRGMGGDGIEGREGEGAEGEGGESMGHGPLDLTKARTRPSVAELLGCRAECLTLDVLGVEMPWLDEAGETETEERGEVKA